MNVILSHDHDHLPELLRQLFGLPDAFAGVFVTGATMANVVGLAQAPQWLGQQPGLDVAQDGLAALGPVRVFSGTPHPSIFKALAMLGLGRAALQPIPLQIEGTFDA